MYIKSYSLCRVKSINFGKCLVPYFTIIIKFHHYCIIKFFAKVSCVALFTFQLWPLLNLWQSLICLPLHNFAFARILCNWNHIVCSFLRLARFTSQYACKIIFSLLTSLFFLIVHWVGIPNFVHPFSYWCISWLHLDSHAI